MKLEPLKDRIRSLVNLQISGPTKIKLSIASLKKNMGSLLWQLVQAKLLQPLDYIINGDQNWCVNNTLNVSFGVPSEAVMLSTKKYCSLSNGSACTSQDYSLSHVLQSMKLPQEQIKSAIRISWGYDTDIMEFKKDFQKFLQVVKELK